jgi:hypothetical protein
MWLILEGGRFLSIVADTKDPSLFQVLAHLPGDIETNFPNAVIDEVAINGYRYQSTVSRQEVVAAVMDELANLNYADLLKTICNPNRVNVANRLQSAMADAQQAALKGEDVGSICVR